VANAERPWAAVLAAFCALTVSYLVARDLFVPHVRDVEVWFGFELRGGLARATAPLHWAIFAVGAWAFATKRAWIWPAASAYAVYVAVSHLVWNVTSLSGGGLIAGLIQLGLFLVPAAVVFSVRPLSRPMEPGDDALRELHAQFRARLPGRIGEVEGALAEARARPDEPEPLAEARRLAHTLKGTASSYGFDEIGDSFEAVEEALEALADSAPHGANLKSKLRPHSSPAWEEIDAAVARAWAALEGG